MPFIFDSFVISKQQKSHKNYRIHDIEKNGMCGKPWDNDSHGNEFQGSTKRYAGRIRNVIIPIWQSLAIVRLSFKYKSQDCCSQRYYTVKFYI